VAIIGPNGAGKTTLIRVIATLMRPDEGELRVAGEPCPERARHARAAIGYMGHDPLVYPDLTARENLELFAALYGVPAPGPRIDALLDRVGLLARSLDPARSFSRGMAQRLGIARMLLHGPRLLVLDEPYSGLDVAGADALDRELAPGLGRTLVVVTHEIDRAHALADRVLVMRSGKVVERIATAELDAGGLRDRYAAIVRER
jgi:heme exporter protein A